MEYNKHQQESVIPVKKTRAQLVPKSETLAPAFKKPLNAQRVMKLPNMQEPILYNNMGME